MTRHNASQSSACRWGGAATPGRSALWLPCQDPRQATRQASPKRQPAGTGRRSTGAFGLMPVGIAEPYAAPLLQCVGTGPALRGRP
jgi:hypothetical protein